MAKFTRDDVDFTIELPDELNHGHIVRWYEALSAVRMEKAKAAKRSTAKGFPHEPDDVFNGAILAATIRCGWVHGLIEENIPSLPPWVTTWAQMVFITLSKARLIPKASSSPPPPSANESGDKTGNQ